MLYFIQITNIKKNHTKFNSKYNEKNNETLESSLQSNKTKLVFKLKVSHV